LLHAKLEIVKADRDKADHEKACKSKKERFSQEFETACECYSSKIKTNDDGINALRTKQRDLTRNATYRIEQKQVFTGINQLLELKLKFSENVVDFDGALCA
jgi:hypothetical protein